MAEVDAVEIANGEDASAGGRAIMLSPSHGGAEGQERGRFFTAARCSCAPSRFLFDLHLKLETVVSELHVRESHLAQAPVGFRVRQIVSGVGEPCTARIELPAGRERLLTRLEQ